MTKQEKKILTEEQTILDKYIDERHKVSDSLYQNIQKQTRRDNLLHGLFGGMIVGMIFGFITNNMTNCSSRSYNEQGRVIEQKSEKHQKTYTMFSMITITTLIGLAFSYVKTRSVSAKQNHNLANKLASEAFKRYFEDSVKKYQWHKTQKIPFGALSRATAFVLSNMPQGKLERLYTLTNSGIACTFQGTFSLSPDRLAVAEKIVSKYIESNNEILSGVTRIMKGENLKTYILPGIKQRTK